MDDPTRLTLEYQHPSLVGVSMRQSCRSIVNKRLGREFTCRYALLCLVKLPQVKLSFRQPDREAVGARPAHCWPPSHRYVVEVEEKTGGS
jgi:hypothetical protein